MFLLADSFGFLMIMALMLGISIQCWIFGIRAMRRNTPPAVKNAVKSAAKIAAKAAIQSQINRRF